MNKIKENGILIIFAIMAIVAIGLAMLFSKSTYNELDYLEFNSGWYVEINGEEYENVTLSDFVFPVLNKGDEIRMSYDIPEDAEMETPVFVVYTIHSVLDIYLDGENVYNYGQKLYEKEKMLGYGYHYINMEDVYAGKSIEMVMKISEDDAFSSIQIPKLCNSVSYYRDFVIKNKVPLAVNMFLIIFGILILLISTIFCFYNKRFFRLLCVGGFSLCIGCWSLCNYDIITMFAYDLSVKAYVEFISLYLAPLFIFLYFWNDKFFTRNKIIETYYKIIVFSQVAFLVVSFALHVFNVAHFPAVLRILHVILIAFCVAFIVLTIYDIVKGKLKNKTLVLGMAVMIFIALSDLLRFSILKYTIATGNVTFTNNICVGALLLVLAQLIDFYTEIMDVFIKGAKAQLLEQIAYIDALTGVANRRQCEMVLDDLDKGASNYGIFSFDLNFLKVTNDTKGHEMGDLLLKTFAKTLSKTFGEIGLVGRIGGDEFIVILPDIEGIDIDKLTQKLESEINIVNKQNPELNLSTAYGFCSHAQLCEHDARKVYKIADERMYEHKVALKAARS